MHGLPKVACVTDTGTLLGLFAGCLVGQSDLATSFAAYMLSNYQWTSFTFQLLALQPPAATAVMAWQLLLLVASMNDALDFMQGE